MSDISARPPAPVLIVLGLFGLTALGCLIVVVALVRSDGFDDTLLPLAGACLSAVVSAGLWRRLKGARVVTILAAVASVLAAMSLVADASVGGVGVVVALPGALVIYLVTAPPSSKEWFGVNNGRPTSTTSRDISDSR